MKYASYMGVAAAIALVAFCFAPWVYIDLIKSTVTGFHTGRTNYGLPGLLHAIFSVVAIALFIVPKIWAKRTNLLVCTLNLAWSIRNFFLLTQCELGECPEKKMGIYAIVFVSLIMLVMSLIPKVNLEEADTSKVL